MLQLFPEFPVVAVNAASVARRVIASAASRLTTHTMVTDRTAVLGQAQPPTDPPVALAGPRPVPGLRGTHRQRDGDLETPQVHAPAADRSVRPRARAEVERAWRR